MEYNRSNRYDTRIVQEKIMGPNPLKLTEELMENAPIPRGATVMDLGSGQGITSVFLAKEYGWRVFATDLWSDPTENMQFFTEMGLTSEQIIPLHADASALPFADEFFDAVVSIDSYNYFGRDEGYLETCLLPKVQHGGYMYICIPGMKKDCHDNLPPELLLSWTADQLAYMRDMTFWRELISKTPGVQILSMYEMEGTGEAWADWLACDNEYAVGDRASMNAGAGAYLNTIAIVLQRT